MYLFSTIRKKRAIKSYIHRLGNDLYRRYGKSEKFTPEQVVKTIHDEGYNWRHICYAHSLYVSHERFDKWHKDQGEACDYHEMREEIANSHFGGSLELLNSSSLSGESEINVVGVESESN
ncbi:hypothetical protein TDB9533_04812 [Thalassocella blandensis]|nr:hypothetical protein TDB9533_04812 [Thalassocella blandensis]